MRPKNFKDIVGQKKAKEVVKTLINFSNEKKLPIPSFLLTAPSGFGKTTMANVIASEINSKILTIDCSNTTFKEIYEVISEANDRDLIFLEECHALKNKVQENLYSAIEEHCIFNNGYREEIPKVTFIGATTNPGSLKIPFKNRFKYIAALEEYSEDELILVCKGICEDRGFKLNNKLAAIIAKTCKGIPRLMVNRTEFIYMFMIGNNLKSINANKIKEIITLQGVDENGLSTEDRNYLLTLFKNRCGLSLANIASKIQVDIESVTKIIEPYLFKLNFASIITSGRILTKDGKNYVEKYIL